MPRRGSVGLSGSSIFKFFGKLHTIFCSGCTNFCSYQQCTRFPLSPHPSATFVISWPFDNSHPNRYGNNRSLWIAWGVVLTRFPPYAWWCPCMCASPSAWEPVLLKHWCVFMVTCSPSLWECAYHSCRIVIPSLSDWGVPCFPAWCCWDDSFEAQLTHHLLSEVFAHMHLRTMFTALFMFPECFIYGPRFSHIVLCDSWDYYSANLYSLPSLVADGVYFLHDLGLGYDLFWPIGY